MKVLIYIKKRLILFITFLVFFVLCIYLFFGKTSSYAWPVYTSPSFQGTIKDINNKSHIENLIIEVIWAKDVFAPIHSQTFIMGKENFLVNRNGKYHIPQKKSLHILSRFNYILFIVRHPLYETKEFIWTKKNLELLKNSDKQNNLDKSKKITKVKGIYNDSSVYFDIKLSSLKEKFKSEAGYLTSGKSLASEFRYEGEKYFKIAKTLGVDLDFATVFKEWEAIAKTFNKDKNLLRSLVDGKNRIKKVIEEDIKDEE